jgi:hypothetical protein
MSATSIPVARILQLGIPIAWQEAVELARAAHQAAESAGVPLLLDECIISTEGTVHLIPAPASSRSGVPLTVLGLLGILIHGQDAPAELRALVDGEDDASSGLPAPTGAGAPPRFDLSWFTSPHADLEIARLATRGIEAAAAQDAQAAIQRLRSDVPDAPPPAEPVTPSRFNLRVLMRPLAIAAAVVLVLMAATLVVQTITGPKAETVAVEGELQPAETKSFLATALDSLKRALAPSGDAPAAADATPAGAPAPAAKRSGGRGTASSPAANAPALSSAPNAGGAPAPTPPASAGGYGEVPTTMDQVVVRAISPRVYSQQDAGVEPPVFVYPQMPSEPKPDSPASDSHIEVMVDEQGRVAQVRLRSTDASLNDRMIVAAAKAWQFRPALKDGQPVPYVLQVPVIR